MTADLPFSTDEPLQLHLDAWEGPLDLLLSLARAQKVDLAQISILQLVEQYLAFIGEARVARLAVAADYLVMAAWLAYLKSCLLLPRDAAADPDPEALAFALGQRLQRLDAMREAAARLLARDRIGRDVFRRGAPEGLLRVRKSKWQASAFDLFAAYGAVRARAIPPLHVVAARAVLSLEHAIERIGAMVGSRIEWTRLEEFLPVSADPAFRRSAMASSFAATLELAKAGRIEISQDAPFAPLRVRSA